jgi:hypothetical protein
MMMAMQVRCMVVMVAAVVAAMQGRLAVIYQQPVIMAMICMGASCMAVIPVTARMGVSGPIRS